MAEQASINSEKICNYLHYIVFPLKLAACWDWFPNPANLNQVITNHIYLGFVLFTLIRFAVGLSVHIYNDFVDIMSCLHEIADSLPILASLVIVSYYAIHRNDLYRLFGFINAYFKHHSAQGLTNMTMVKSYETAKKFAKIYTACTMFSVTMYTTVPVVVYWWTQEPTQVWFFADVSGKAHFVFICLQSLVSQWLVGLAMGQFGVFFAANSILICGQLDLLCCSLRNLRFTALLRRGVPHAALAAAHGDVTLDERHGHVYNQPEMRPSSYHYDQKMVNNSRTTNLQFDIYSSEYDEATMSTVRDCAVMCQVVMQYKNHFERFVSPLLVLRVVQVTLYLCTLLYAATLHFDMTTAEYLAAVVLDLLVYCYYGNQIILQADRVSTAAYQSSWHTIGVRPRRALVNLLLANRRPVVVRAGKFLPMDLRTFLIIIKTSFSYYTLLVNVNEK